MLFTLIPPTRTSVTPQVPRYRVYLPSLPRALRGFTVLQISDLHSQRFGPDGRALLQLVGELSFDLSALTGDLVNGKSWEYYDLPALELAEALVDRAPVYFVTGNHEWSSPDGELLPPRLAERGVRVLRNSAELLAVPRPGQPPRPSARPRSLQRPLPPRLPRLQPRSRPLPLPRPRKGAAAEVRLGIIGMDDITYFDENPACFSAALERALAEVASAEVRILLSHRPELFAVYRRHQIDLALSGHAHGGQIRLPHIGGLFAPGQGLLPPFDAGAFVEDSCCMIVNRGLGRSAFPWRINNPPEIALIELTDEHPRGADADSRGEAHAAARAHANAPERTGAYAHPDGATQAGESGARAHTGATQTAARTHATVLSAQGGGCDAV